MRALVATEHAMLISIWHMLITGEIYHELGADYYRRDNSGRSRRRAIAELHRFGYEVELNTAS